MSEEPTNAERNRFLLTSLGIMLIFILTLLVLLAAYPLVLAPPPTLTPTFTLTRTPSQTPSQTPTITLTPRPTRTRRPAFTPTASLTPSLTPFPSQTPLPPGPPTLTPARPLAGENIYSLQPWSPEKADQVTELMNYYPNTLSKPERGEKDSNYYAAFRYAVDAYREALLRFPDAPQARKWRWGLAYNLGRLGDPQAGKVYADLIAGVLNQEAIDPQKLPAWFRQNEPRLMLAVSEMTPLPGYLSTYLVQITGAEGGVALLLLETPAAYQVHILASEFDFVNAVPLEAFSSDLTGDGLEEVIIFIPAPAEDLALVPPRVFDLSQQPVQGLPFDPISADLQIGTDFNPLWTAVSDSANGPLLQMQTELFPFCPVTITRTYRWSGERFEEEQTEFEIQPNPATLNYCALVLEHAYRTWGAKTAADFADALLPVWPPESDLNGDPYPPDAAAELRFRLGIYQALAGEFDTAVKTLTNIIADPASQQSSWAAAALDFLEIYNTPRDLYRACTSHAYCDPSQALEHLVNSLPTGAAPTLATYLWDIGVAQRASGYYDFDGDGTTERWLTVQHRPGEKLEFWIFTPHLQGVSALRVATVESDRPRLDVYQDGEIPPVLILDGETAFKMDRRPDDLTPYLTYPNLPQLYPNRFEQALEPTIADLFNGADPADIRQRLLALQDTPGLLCTATWSCDRYYYMLALASELAGDQRQATDTLVQLWWDYSRSPYTNMARLRLRVPLITPTLSPTVTNTVLVTLTPTVTGTPPTETPTADPNATLTPTLTATISATPYPPP